MSEMIGDFLHALEIVAGVVFFVCSVLAWAAMSPSTRHCFRAVYGILGIGGAAIALDPFFDAGVTPYARAALLIGFALYLILDRRRIRPDRRDPEATVPSAGALGAVAIVLSFLVMPPAESAPIAIGQRDGITVVLTNERCALEAVKNLPARVTWTENGKTSEGCYGMAGQLIIAYFDDRTVVFFAAQGFVPVSPT
jgi:hypothetical protein